MPTETLGRTLLALARQAIEERFRERPPPVAAEPALAENGAVFVTLTQDGRLRGCIGSLEAWRPLADDVRENARAAAFRDPRFSPLTADELPRTRIEISLLTPAEALHFTDEADLLRQLHPGEDGIILQCDGQRATFLPQVWEQLPDPRRFIDQLKRKAGLAGDFWSEAMQVSRYRVEKWKEAR